MKTFTFFITIACVTATSPDFITSNNLFAASSYKEAIKNGDENLLISPFSAEVIIALAQSGAKGDTAEEIRSSLQLSNNPEGIKTSIKDTLHSLKNNGSYSLHTANKIYLGKNFDIKSDFRSLAEDKFLSQVETIDFGESDQAASTINQWVEDQTNKKIKNLVDPSSVNAGTPAMLVNTLYFRANWSDRDFHKGPILKRDFHKSATEVVKVDTMAKQGARLNYYESPEVAATFLEMPFEGKDASMVIVLPKDNEGLEQVEKEVDKVLKPQPFEKVIVDVTMPMFKIESKIDFKKIMQQLGMRKAFSLGEADFSGIAGSKGDLAVDGILQKTYIHVNRDGVEAAAATDLWFFLSGPPPATKTVVVDHPFIFYIKVKDVILFVGRVLLPTL